MLFNIKRVCFRNMIESLYTRLNQSVVFVEIYGFRFSGKFGKTIDTVYSLGYGLKGNDCILMGLY